MAEAKRRNLGVAIVLILGVFPALIALGLWLLRSAANIPYLVGGYYTVVVLGTILDGLNGFRWWRRVARRGL